MAWASGLAEVLEDDGLTSRFGAEWIRRRQSGGPPMPLDRNLTARKHPPVARRWVYSGPHARRHARDRPADYTCFSETAVVPPHRFDRHDRP